MADYNADTCSLCGRSVRRGQVSCTCGNILSGDDYRPKPPAGPASSGKVKPYGALIPWVPLVGALVLLFWIIDISPADFNGMRLFKVAAVVVLLSSLFALLDAERISKQPEVWPFADSPLRDVTPAAWFGAMVAAWPLAFPAFLYTYYARADRNRMIFGCTAAGLMLFGTLVLWPASSSPPPPPTPPTARTGGTPQAAARTPSSAPTETSDTAVVIPPPLPSVPPVPTP